MVALAVEIMDRKIKHGFCMVAFAAQVMGDFFLSKRTVCYSDECRQTQTFHERLTLRNTTDCFHGKLNNLCAFIWSSTCNQLLHFLGCLCNALICSRNYVHLSYLSTTVCTCCRIGWCALCGFMNSTGLSYIPSSVSYLICILDCWLQLLIEGKKSEKCRGWRKRNGGNQTMRRQNEWEKAKWIKEKF